MSLVRPLTMEDIPALAGMFQRVFRNENQPVPAELQSYLSELYLTSPGCDSEIMPLVHVNGQDRLTGFIGVNVLPMELNGRQLRAAICGSLMAEDRENDPMAGARLLKAFLAGPQDLSLSETASEVSVQMWTSLRGIVLPRYSLDWVRIIRPASFFTNIAASRIGAMRLLNPLARLADGVLRNRMQKGDYRWSGVPTEGLEQKSYKTVEIDQQGFAALFAPLTAQFALRPAWSEPQFSYILSTSLNKPQYGPAIFGAVQARTGKPVGAFLYHLKPGQIARVLQVLALPGQEGATIDALVNHAAARGAAGIRGRTQPALMEAMLGRRIAFTHIASTVVHSRDGDLVRAFPNAQGFINGLAGEHWSRLSGGEF